MPPTSLKYDFFKNEDRSNKTYKIVLCWKNPLFSEPNQKLNYWYVL